MTTLRISARIGWARTVAAVLAAASISYGLGNSPALAIAVTPGGCDAVNSGAFNLSVPPSSEGSRIVSGFKPGDVITFVVTRTGVVPGATDGGIFALLNALNSELYSSPGGNIIPEATSYTVTGTDDATLTAVLSNLDISISLSATCAPAAGKSNSDSQRLRMLQVIGSNVVAQTSGAAISGAVGSAISAGLGGGQAGGTATGGAPTPPAGLGEPRNGLSRLGAAIAPPSGLGLAPGQGRLASPWKTWADVRGTGWDIEERDQRNLGLKGTQLNATFGLGHLVQPGLLIGVLGGYENFDYTARALDGRLKGDGWTVGGYLGWAFAPRLRLDVALAHSLLDYNMSAGTAVGSTDGHRWMLSTGITGNFDLGSL